MVADYECQVGESPVWHSGKNRLYWSDILTGRLFWYEPATGRSSQCYEGRMVGGFTIQADGSLLLFMDKGTVAVWRNGEIVRTVIDSIPAELEQRFNDVAADPEGRVFCGTMPLDNVERRSGRLYRLDPDGSYRVLLEGVGISNGIGFSPDRKFLYYIDSLDDIVWLFAYDRATGELTDRQMFLEFSAENGSPDGLTIDRDGDLWIAMAMGGALVQYSPEAELVQRIELPAKFVASVAFGGVDLTQLFVTTGLTDKVEDSGEAAGTLMVMEPGVVGLPEYRSRITI